MLIYAMLIFMLLIVISWHGPTAWGQFPENNRIGKVLPKSYRELEGVKTIDIFLNIFAPAIYPKSFLGSCIRPPGSHEVSDQIISHKVIQNERFFFNLL